MKIFVKIVSKFSGGILQLEIRKFPNPKHSRIVKLSCQFLEGYITPVSGQKKIFLISKNIFTQTVNDVQNFIISFRQLKDV